MSVQYPETLVLGITTHGSIPIQEENAAMMQVPEGMRITKISAVPIGVCNMTVESNIEVLSAYITKIFRTDLPEQEKIDAIVKTMKHMQNATTSFVQKDKTSTDNSKQFILHSYKPPSVVTYTEGKDILNKDYLRGTYEGSTSAYDYKINMLNVAGTPDLLRIMATGRTIAPTRQMQYMENVLVNLHAIVLFLQQRGVKNIILFDLSCAVMEEATPRKIRAERRTLGNKGLNGGRKKTKRRSTKKRTLSKWRHNSRRR
jgi:hypothetical protein